MARFTMSDTASCGDGVCSVTESNASCAADCATGCGDRTCDAGGGETGTNCPVDCGGNHIDLAFKRAAWGAVLEARDLAPSSLTGGGDFVRSAAFTYDGAARLTAATIGGKKWDTGAASWDAGSSWDYSFSYAYDATQNMTQRTAPTGVDVYAGDYAYAGAGAGPRQLTSVTPIGGGAGQTFSYDVAGRQQERIDNTLPVGQRKTTMLYDPFDRVRVVTRNADSGSPDVIKHWYGYDGERIRTEYPTNHGLGGEPLEDELRFGPGLVVRGDDLELVLAMGSRPIARLEVAMDASAAGEVRWLHQTFGPGPSVVSDENGQVVQDRLYAPFGTLLTARDVSGASTSNADLLLSTEPLSWVNKEVDRATTWSDHGARWYAARTGRWLSPDPPVKGPSKDFLLKPWDAHPYQYGRQSPVVFWDPDGNNPQTVQLAATAFSGLLLGGLAPYHMDGDDPTNHQTDAEYSEATRGVNQGFKLGGVGIAVQFSAGACLAFAPACFAFATEESLNPFPILKDAADLSKWARDIGKKGWQRLTKLFGPDDLGHAPMAVPHGFSNASDFASFSQRLRGGLSKAGFDDVHIFFQGSSVTGKSFRTGAPFDAGRVSDFDIALGSPSLLQKAKSLGIGLRSGGTRTGPLRASDVRKLGLTDLQSQLSKQAGRPVNFIIFQDGASAAGRAPSILAP